MGSGFRGHGGWVGAGGSNEDSNAPPEPAAMPSLAAEASWGQVINVQLSRLI